MSSGPITSIAFMPDGTAIGLYSDRFPLGILGRTRISRGSHVEFSNRRKRWEVFLPGRRRTPLFTSRMREPCLRWEARHLIDHFIFNQGAVDAVRFDQ